MPRIETNTFSGTSSYPTGGFTINTGLTTCDFLDVEVLVQGANLNHHHIEVSRSGANATVKIMRHRYDKSPANTGAVTGLPSGVTASSSSGQTYDASGNHLHTIDHDHPAKQTSSPNGGAGGTPLNAAGSSTVTTHTHNADPPNFTGNSGNENGHTHTWNNIYQHQHSITNTSTDPTLTEIANGTNLSTTTFNYIAVEN